MPTTRKSSHACGSRGRLSTCCVRTATSGSPGLAWNRPPSPGTCPKAAFGLKDKMPRKRISFHPKEEPMLTRREVLIGAIAAGATMHLRTGFAKASQPATPVNFDVPAGACDCHTHIHGDPEKFPFFAGRVYTPETALPEEMAALHRALRMQRVVIVTPSVYGTDNAATLWGMAARGADARGVAVIDDKTSESELDAMGRAGVCGVRLNLSTGG